MHRILVCLPVVLFIMACNDNTARKNGYSDTPKTAEDSLYHAVMEGHDIGMAKIGKVKKYNARLQVTIDSLQKSGVKDLTFYQRVREDLHRADSAMFRWMEEFRADSATGNTEQRIHYLQQEKEKVTAVKDAILGSLQRADSLLGKQQ